MTGYGGNPREEIFHPNPRNLLLPERPFLSLRRSGEGGGGGGGGGGQDGNPSSLKEDAPNGYPLRPARMPMGQGRNPHE